MQHPLIYLLKAYKSGISPFLPFACRFQPTCSDYAQEAVRRHGAFRGGLLALRRLLRCHPWGAGGFDPVPDEGCNSTQNR
jgi:putative membrane protein insertion efficiency factor